MLGNTQYPSLTHFGVALFVVAKRRQHLALGFSPRSLSAIIRQAAKRRQQSERQQFAVAASRLGGP